MTEVSCRAFSYFVAGERHGLFDLDALLEGLPVTRGELMDPSRRVSWSVWARLCERAAAQLDHDARRIAASGRLVLETGQSGFAGFLGPAAGLFTDVRDLVDLVGNWAAPSLYRSHTFAIEGIDELRFRFVARLRPEFTPCLPWFQMLPGALEVMPCFLGLPEAAVEVEELSETSIRILVTAPSSRTVGSRLRRIWDGLQRAGPSPTRLRRPRSPPADRSWTSRSRSRPWRPSSRGARRAPRPARLPTAPGVRTLAWSCCRSRSRSQI